MTVIFIFLGRATDTLIPAVALPLSLLLTFIAMKVLGYSLDNLSLMALTLAIGFLVDDAIVFLENTVRLMEDRAQCVRCFRRIGQGDQLHDSCHDALAGGGLHSAGVHERAHGAHLPRVLDHDRHIDHRQRPGFANAHSLMTSRLLTIAAKEQRRPGWNAGLARSSTACWSFTALLWFFLRNRWISAVTWAVCLAGTAYLFYVVPKSFLPVGDSSFIRGILVAQEGSSPDQMHAYQTQAEKIMKANPAVRSTFTMSGNAAFLGSNRHS